MANQDMIYKDTMLPLIQYIKANKQLECMEITMLEDEWQMLAEALEKQIPEKPYRIHANIFHCGSEKCDAHFTKAGDEHEIFKYCPYCGQAIDWSDDDE